MATDPTKLGNETRTSVLPSSSVGADVDLMGPAYDYSGELPTPGNVGVRKGDSLESVINAVKGVAYYSDMIGFGESSSSLTRGMPLFPMGVNYFTKTGATCSNGAEMWTYVSGIPTGDSMGKATKNALQSAGLPGLRGLSPGIMEDAQSALNPMPVVNTILGTGYARCKQVTLPVGDHKGALSSSAGDVWIADRGDINRSSGRPQQTKWVLDSWISQDDYNNEFKNKTFCSDGSAIANHQDRNCSKPLVREGFRQQGVEVVAPAATILVCLVAALYMRYF